MRIHSNILTAETMHVALNNVSAQAPNVVLYVQGQHGSRSHTRAFEVALRGEGARHTRHPNTGVRGAASDEYAATYDDWGWFLSALYERDASLKAGPYRSRAQFHTMTKNAFLPL